MTDDDPIPDKPASPNGASNGAGSSRAGKAAVRSGLAQRRNPVLVRVGEIASGVLRLLLRDPLSTFLLIASIGLAVAFATLLGSIQPSSSGTEVPVSSVLKLAKGHEIANAVLLDHDSRVELNTTAKAPRLLANGALPPATTSTTIVKGKHGHSHTVTTAVEPVGAGILQRLWAAYPASGAQTEQLATELFNSGATVSAGTVGPAQVLPIYVPAGYTLTPTYTGTLTWTWLAV